MDVCFILASGSLALEMPLAGLVEVVLVLFELLLSYRHRREGQGHREVISDEESPEAHRMLVWIGTEWNAARTAVPGMPRKPQCHRSCQQPSQHPLAGEVTLDHLPLIPERSTNFTGWVRGRILDGLSAQLILQSIQVGQLFCTSGQRRDFFTWHLQ